MFSGLQSLFEQIQYPNPKDETRWRKILSYLDTIDYSSKIRGRENKTSVMILPSLTLDLLSRQVTQGETIDFLGNLHFDMLQCLMFPSANIRTFEGVWLRLCLDLKNSLDPYKYQYNSNAYVYIRLDDMCVNQKQLATEISSKTNYSDPTDSLREFYSNTDNGFTFGLTETLQQKLTIAGLYRNFNQLSSSLDEQSTYYHRLVQSLLMRYFQEYHQFQRTKGNDLSKKIPPMNLVINLPDVTNMGVMNYDIQSLEHLQSLLKFQLIPLSASQSTTISDEQCKGVQWLDIINMDDETKLKKANPKLDQRDIKYELDAVNQHNPNDRPWIIRKLCNLLYQIDTTVDNNTMKNLVESFQHPIIPLLIILNCLNINMVFTFGTLRETAKKQTEMIGLKQFDKVKIDDNIKNIIEKAIKQSSGIINPQQSIKSVISKLMTELGLDQDCFDTISTLR